MVILNVKRYGSEKLVGASRSFGDIGTSTLVLVGLDLQ
jgi:hypothetical protein